MHFWEAVGSSARPPVCWPLQAPSLWHEMQQREADTAEGEPQQREDSVVFQTAGGLFADEPAAPFWHGAAAHARAASRDDSEGEAAASPAEQMAAGDDAESRASNVGEPDRRGATAATRHLARGCGTGTGTALQRGSSGEASGSIMKSVFGAVRSLGRALLPPSLHKLLDGAARKYHGPPAAPTVVMSA